VYPGNLRGVPVETRCPGCGEMLIRRLGYAVVASAPDPSVCPTCGRRLAGLWTARPAREAA
jgi:pyruvate formate lyase activating enzyme